jgi:CheY-like chemotaxis protein
MFETAGQEFSLSLPNTPVRLEADPVRLAQVLTNLLTNASKYTESGGRVSLSAERHGDEVVVRVSDTGIGIEPGILPHVFDLFTQSTRTIDRAQGGLGIGLTIVKSLVEMHGGSVAAHSEGPGRGTEFTVRLPVSEASADASAVTPEDAPVGSLRILVVDDNVPAAKLLVRLLRKLGDHEVITAHDGEGALAAAEAYRPELILLDIGLPRMDGYEVARRLRARPEFDAVLLAALTGYGTEDDRRRTAAAGFDTHLVKPPGVDMLREIIAHPKLRRK